MLLAGAGTALQMLPVLHLGYGVLGGLGFAMGCGTLTADNSTTSPARCYCGAAAAAC